MCVFSDEATFHAIGKVKRHNLQIWGLVKKDSLKVNVWCGLVHNQIIGPFIFAKSTITANIYLDVLKHYVVPQLEEFHPWVVLQQNGAPPLCLGFDSSWLFKWNFCKPMDRKKWPSNLAAKISRYYTFIMFFVRFCERQSVQNASKWCRSVEITNQRCSGHCKRRNAGEHLARNWVSPWHIESNKWSTCWNQWIARKIKFSNYGYYLNC